MSPMKPCLILIIFLRWPAWCDEDVDPEVDEADDKSQDDDDEKLQE
jgi:hypothetical protein